MKAYAQAHPTVRSPYVLERKIRVFVRKTTAPIMIHSVSRVGLIVNQPDLRTLEQHCLFTIKPILLLVTHITFQWLTAVLR